MWSLDRNTFILLTVLAIIALFVVTGFVVKFYRANERVLAREWYRRGEAELNGGRPVAAIEDFRTALTYSRDNPRYRLRLAQALVAANHFEEARTYLLSLWESEPGNGTVNLELGRLAVRQRSVPDAQRYFHNAIYGEWDNDALRRRREARLELTEFLLQVGQTAQAQAELIALAADLPPDPELQTQVGTLLLKVADYDGALTLFKKALALQPNLEAARAGVGQAYFELNNFRQAQIYLSRALAENPHLTHTASMLETTRMVLDIDPFRRRLSSRERARRAMKAFSQAMTRLQGCAERRGVVLDAPGADPELQNVYAQAVALKPKLREQTLARDSDLLMTTIDLVFDTEKVAERKCGPPQGLDLALILLARTQGGAQP